jgi:hypothetical protein
MKLQTKTYEPVDTSIWIDYDQESLVKDSKLVLPGGMKLPPFCHAAVLAVGPKCVQVKAGDTVLVAAGTVMQMKVSGEPDVFFTQENKIVAIVRDAGINGVRHKVVEFAEKSD